MSEGSDIDRQGLGPRVIRLSLQAAEALSPEPEPYFTNSISRYVGNGQISCGIISSS